LQVALDNGKRFTCSIFAAGILEIFRQLDSLPAHLCGGALAIGNFDGVHLGHAAIVQALKKKASHYGGAAMVFTFDPHPVRLLRPEQVPPPLTWTDRKAELLAEQGVDAVIAYPTDKALLALSAQDFFEKIVCARIGARGMVEGENFYFGRDREGDIPLLRTLCSAANVDLEIVPPVVLGGKTVSSSRIRTALSEGDVTTATEMLTHPYRLRGMVTHGVGRGAALGFPTANLEAIETIIPADGVYAGIGHAGNRKWAAAIHVGPNPTFGEMHRKVELHLLDCSETLYGMALEVDFGMRLRDTGKFAGAESLKDQVALDIAEVRRWWAANNTRGTV
jgi:riboflavin kinase/FMN adenylyltransferase